MQNVVDGTVPMDQKELSRRKDPAVNLVCEENPDGRKYYLPCHHPHQWYHGNQPAMNQCQLKIGHHIDAEKRKNL